MPRPAGRAATGENLPQAGTPRARSPPCRGPGSGTSIQPEEIIMQSRRAVLIASLSLAGVVASRGRPRRRAAAGLRLALQRARPLRLGSARRRQRPLEGDGRRHRLRRRERGHRRQEPVDRRRSTATSCCASTGGSRRRPTSTPTSRSSARRHAQGRGRQGDPARRARLRLRHLAARLEQVADQHLVLADRLGRGLRLPDGREATARGPRRSHTPDQRRRPSASGTPSRSPCRATGSPCC